MVPNYLSWCCWAKSTGRVVTLIFNVDEATIFKQYTSLVSDRKKGTRKPIQRLFVKDTKLRDIGSVPLMNSKAR